MFFNINDISRQYHELKSSAQNNVRGKMPGDVFFTDDGKILSIPGKNSDCRYPYGYNGFNFWAHASGYMYCNDGLFSVFMKAAEGQEPRIAFFAGFNLHDNEYEVIPLLAVPIEHVIIDRNP